MCQLDAAGISDVLQELLPVDAHVAVAQQLFFEIFNQKETGCYPRLIGHEPCLTVICTCRSGLRKGLFRGKSSCTARLFTHPELLSCGNISASMSVFSPFSSVMPLTTDQIDGEPFSLLSANNGSRAALPGTLAEPTWDGTQIVNF